MNDLAQSVRSPDAATVQTLLEIARQHGTPTYAFDLARLRTQVEKLRRQLPAELEILYSLKANASLGICDAFAQIGIGADVASAGELVTAVEAGFSRERIFVAGPFKAAETTALLQEVPEAIVSVDSLSELESLINLEIRNRLVLRLRPDFGSAAVVAAGHDCRFGFTEAELGRCRALLDRAGVAPSRPVPSTNGAGRYTTRNVIGFHVFAGSQVLETHSVIEHFRAAFRLCMRAAEALEITPTFLNLGGGLGIPYGANDVELDLAPIGRELDGMIQRNKGTRFAIELGRYLVAQSGWYLASVLGFQTHQGRRAVVVDGGTHQRADICGLCLRSKSRPVLLDATSCTPTRSVSEGPPSLATPTRSVSEGPSSLAAQPRSVSEGPSSVAARAPTVDESTYFPTDVLGSLSLPADVLAEASLLPPLEPGSVLAFPNAGAYGLWSSPVLFHGSPLPAEVVFDGSMIQAIRERQPARSILQNQRHLRPGSGVVLERQDCT